MTALDTEAVARALRAAADALRPEPAGPRPAAGSVSTTLYRAVVNRLGQEQAVAAELRQQVADLTEARDVAVIRQREAGRALTAAGRSGGKPPPGRLNAAEVAERAVGHVLVPAQAVAYALEALERMDSLEDDEPRAKAYEAAWTTLVEAANTAVGAEAWARIRKNTPSAPLSRPVSAETPPGTPEAPNGGPGPENGAQAILAVVEAARAWRAMIVDPPNAWADDHDLGLIAAVDALDGIKATDYVVGPEWADAAHEFGWRAGARWAADEAQAQASHHSLPWRGAYADLGDLTDITDHLNLCADDPYRETLVPRKPTPTTESDHAPA